MSFGKIWTKQSIRSKFTLVFGLMFLLSTSIPLMLTLLFTFESLKNSNRSEILDKAAELQVEYRYGGLKEVVKAVEIDNTLHFDRPFYIRISDQQSNETIFSSTPTKWLGFDFSRLSNSSIETDDGFIVLRQQDAGYTIEIAFRPLSDRYILQVGSSTKMRDHVIKASINTFLMIIIPSAVLVLFLVWLISSSMLRPISNVVKTVRTVITTGQYNHQIPEERSSREFDELVEMINQMFSKLNKMITDLKTTLETVAHDMRTPMTRIRTRAEVAVQQPADSREMEQALYSIIDESETIGSLLRLILDAAEAESGIVKLEEKEIDLVAVCRDAAEVYEYVADSKSVSVGVETPPALTVYADPARIQQAVGNLLDNAVKYTYPETRVEMELQVNEQGVDIIVRDRGDGIEEGSAADIWKPRYRFPKKSGLDGYGLGLTIVKAVAEAHNGSVHVQNRPEGGAEFVFHLPAARLVPVV